MALSQTTSNANWDYTIATGSSRRSKWTYYFPTSKSVCARYEKDKTVDVTVGPTLQRHASSCAGCDQGRPRGGTPLAGTPSRAGASRGLPPRATCRHGSGPVGYRARERAGAACLDAWRPQIGPPWVGWPTRSAGPLFPVVLAQKRPV
jgi:hypothetical protein